ncbi:hypothetical protein MMC20_000616 [Loxospora ochrophaea]|nr:hypothetical protein [Loxospora ochrophaea]
MSPFKSLFFLIPVLTLTVATPFTKRQNFGGFPPGTCEFHAELSGSTDSTETDLSVNIYDNNGNYIRTGENLAMNPGDDLLVYGPDNGGQQLKFVYLNNQDIGEKTQTYWPLVMSYGTQTWYPSDKQCKVGGFDNLFFGSTQCFQSPLLSVSLSTTDSSGTDPRSLITVHHTQFTHSSAPPSPNTSSPSIFPRAGETAFHINTCLPEDTFIKSECDPVPRGVRAWIITCHTIQAEDPDENEDFPGQCPPQWVCIQSINTSSRLLGNPIALCVPGYSYLSLTDSLKKQEVSLNAQFGTGKAPETKLGDDNIIWGETASSTYYSKYGTKGKYSSHTVTAVLTGPDGEVPLVAETLSLSAQGGQEMYGVQCWDGINTDFGEEATGESHVAGGVKRGEAVFGRLARWELRDLGWETMGDAMGFMGSEREAVLGSGLEMKEWSLCNLAIVCEPFQTYTGE